MPDPTLADCRVCKGTGFSTMTGRRCKRCPLPVPQRPWWDVLPGDYNELTRERDGAEADAIAEQHERDRLGY